MSDSKSSVVPSDRSAKWHEYVQEFGRGQDDRLVLAAMGAWLAGLKASELAGSVDEALPAGLPARLANTVAAMVEHRCALAQVMPPVWAAAIPPLEQPVFGSQLMSLRLHLLANSPPAFRRRNLFVDTVVGGQI